MATATGESGLGFETETLSTLDYLGIGFALVTAVIHLFLGVQFAPDPLGLSFILAGAGFLGAVVLLLLGVRRKLLYAVGVPYTAVQIVLWYYLNFAAGPYSFPADVGTMGVVDKVAQVGLIVVLAVLYSRS